MKARFRVRTLTTVETMRDDGSIGKVYEIHLTPYMPEFQGDPENPVDDVLFDAAVDAVPADFQVAGGADFIIDSRDPIAAGAIIDLQIEAVFVP